MMAMTIPMVTKPTITIVHPCSMTSCLRSSAPVAAAEPLVVPDPAAEGQPQALVLGLSPELAGSFEQDILL